MKRFIIFALLLLSLFLMMSPNLLSGKPDEYFPLAVGNFWQYKTNLGVNVVSTVNGMASVRGVTCYVFAWGPQGGSAPTQIDYYAIGSNGIYCYRRDTPAGAIEYNPPQKIMPVPMAPQNWQWVSKDGSIKATFSCTGPEMITIMGQKVQAYRVTAVVKEPQGGLTYKNSWYVKTAGLVKEEVTGTSGGQKIQSIMELVNLGNG